MLQLPPIGIKIKTLPTSPMPAGRVLTALFYAIYPGLVLKVVWLHWFFWGRGLIGIIKLVFFGVCLLVMGNYGGGG